MQTFNRRFSVFASIRAFLLPIVGMAGFLVTCSPAMAQFGGQAGFSEAFQRDFFRRDMQLFVDYLRLEDWQRPVIEVLLDDYQVSFDAGTEQCKDKMANLRDEMLASPDQAMEIALRPIKEWEVEKEQMKLEFIENIRTQLSPLQMERWPSLERAMRREKELPQGEIPGESMNVFATLHGMELPPDMIQTIDPILLRYEVDLDKALDNRRAQMDQYQPILQDAMVSKDYDAGLRGLRNIVDARKRVCDTHFIVIEELHRSLPQELGDQFRDIILLKGFAEIYKPNSVDRLLEAVRLLPDLSPEQDSALNIIEAEYRVSIAQSNEQLLAANRAFGSEIPILEAKKAIARRNQETVERGSGVPEQIAKLKNERQKMLDDYRQRIIDLLLPAQSAKIPATAKFDRRGDKLRERLSGGSLSPNGTRNGGSGSGNTVSNPDKEKRKQGKGGSSFTPLRPKDQGGGPKKIED